MLLLIGLSILLFLVYLLVQKYQYNRLLNKTQYRVHVNGIRGKSSVTRYIAAIFREANHITYAKTTGTKARIIDSSGNDIEIKRNGFPNVNEQVDIIKNFVNKGATSIVVECMAVNPLYQEWLQEKVIKSNITVITNVRIDHTDYMGETLELIAKSLATTIPVGGILITSEDNPVVLKIFKKICIEKNSKMVLAKKTSVSNLELNKFGYYAHKENVAIGLKVAKIIGLDRQRALKSMYLANPDPGSFKVESIKVKGKQIAWANLFAINDKESFINVAKDIYAKFPNYSKVVILNNRFDRPSRVKLFTDIVTKEQVIDKIVTFGDFEALVNSYAIRNGFSKKNILNLGNSTKTKEDMGKQLLGSILKITKSKNILIVGTVNIHTKQADLFLDYITSLGVSRISANAIDEEFVHEDVGLDINFNKAYA